MSDTSQLICTVERNNFMEIVAGKPSLKTRILVDSELLVLEPLIWKGNGDFQRPSFIESGVVQVWPPCLVPVYNAMKKLVVATHTWRVFQELAYLHLGETEVDPEDVTIIHLVMDEKVQYHIIDISQIPEGELENLNLSSNVLDQIETCGYIVATKSVPLEDYLSDLGFALASQTTIIPTLSRIDFVPEDILAELNEVVALAKAILLALPAYLEALVEFVIPTDPVD